MLTFSRECEPCSRLLGADLFCESSLPELTRWRSSFNCVRDFEGAFGAADSNGEARAPVPFRAREGGGDTECGDEMPSCGCVRLAAERARRAASRLEGGDEVVGECGFLCCSRCKAARVDCKCEIELDVVLPEPEDPAGFKKREMPSERREGSVGLEGGQLLFVP